MASLRVSVTYFGYTVYAPYIPSLFSSLTVSTQSAMHLGTSLTRPLGKSGSKGFN
jgi:hypothetical protein